jgi:hypothetical protein
MASRQLEITETIARKVLSVVDRGLSSGLGNRRPGEMCVEAAVCYALDLPHGDDPACVSRALRSLKIRLNDSSWSSKKARAAGLRRLAVAQLGSRDHLDDKEFGRRVAKLAIHKSVPIALRAAASINKNAKDAQALRDAASRCEAEGTRGAALAARKVAQGARKSADADAAAYAYASAAAAAYADAYASADADAAAYAYASADAAAAAYADAYAAGAADAGAARDKSLADFAEGVVQILIEMKAPGCRWLALTEQVPA